MNTYALTLLITALFSKFLQILSIERRIISKLYDESVELSFTDC